MSATGTSAAPSAATILYLPLPANLKPSLCIVFASP